MKLQIFKRLYFGYTITVKVPIYISHAVGNPKILFLAYFDPNKYTLKENVTMYRTFCIYTL